MTNTPNDYPEIAARLRRKLQPAPTRLRLTVRDVMRVLGRRSTSSALYVIDGLVDNGYAVAKKRHDGTTEYYLREGNDGERN